MSEVDDLRKRYGKRYAFEWFMRAEDKRYWKMTQSMIEKESRKATAIIAINAVAIAILAIAIIIKKKK